MAEETRVLVPGTATGPAVVLEEPLSFWGGFDPATGLLVDPHHPQVGAELAGCVLVMPAGRGSSSSSSVLAEAVRAGTAPAAVVLGEPDPIVALGAIVAEELYGTAPPIVVAPRPGIVTGRRVTVRAAPDDRVELEEA
jgi:predicted aconitase with swiveling domain